MAMPKLRRTRSISQRRSDVSRSVKTFLETDSPSMRQLRSQVLRPLEEIGEVAIVGGLIRDIIRYGVDNRPISDIDLVVQGSPSAVAAIAKKLSATPNRFGGFGLVNDYFKVDFWALSTTWARSHANVDIFRIEHIPSSTFFNWDAVVYSTKSHRTYFNDQYLEDMNRKILEINLELTASHLGNLIRALRRLFAWQAHPGPKLLNFIEEARSYYSWEDVIRQEKSAFYTAYLDRFSEFDEYLKYLVGKGDWRIAPVQLSLFPEESAPHVELSVETFWSDMLESQTPDLDQQSLPLKD